MQKIFEQLLEQGDIESAGYLYHLSTIGDLYEIIDDTIDVKRYVKRCKENDVRFQLAWESLNKAPQKPIKKVKIISHIVFDEIVKNEKIEKTLLNLLPVNIISIQL